MQDRSGCPDRRKRSRKASDTALAVVAAGIGRVENGEIRPLRKGNYLHNTKAFFRRPKFLNFMIFSLI